MRGVFETGRDIAVDLEEFLDASAWLDGLRA